jgi:hypothetical protein
MRRLCTRRRWFRRRRWQVVARKHRRRTSRENLDRVLTRGVNVQNVVPIVLIDNLHQQGSSVGENTSGTVGGVVGRHLR